MGVILLDMLSPELSFAPSYWFRMHSARPFAQSPLSKYGANADRRGGDLLQQCINGWAATRTNLGSYVYRAWVDEILSALLGMTG